jgi:hypothetical protein
MFNFMYHELIRVLFLSFVQMEYQGIDPDVRGPFPQCTGGLRSGGSMINPA